MLYTISWVIAILFFVVVLVIGINVMTGKTKINIIGVIGLVLFIIMVIGFANNASKQEQMVKAAYKEGYQTGYTERDHESNSTAFEAGHEAGVEEGLQYGREEGYTRGHDAGVTEGYAKGWSAGKQHTIENAQLLEVTNDGYAIMFGNEDEVHDYDWDW